MAFVDIPTRLNGQRILRSWFNDLRDAGIALASAGAIGKQEVPVGIVNGINPVFGPLLFAPTTPTSVWVAIDGIKQRYGTDFTVSGSTITFQAGSIPLAGQEVDTFYLTSGTAAAPITSAAYRAEYRTITAPEAAAKSITLAFTPGTPSYVSLDVIGGGAQFFGTDFTVIANALNWGGFALDGVLVAGDQVRVTYTE